MKSKQGETGVGGRAHPAEILKLLPRAVSVWQHLLCHVLELTHLHQTVLIRVLLLLDRHTGLG